MVTALYRSIMITFLLALLLCGIYPLAVYGIGQVLFRSNADGSLVLQGGHAVGSEWIGQVFSKPEYFHGRPSAAGDGYDAANSSGSNLGPTSAKMLEGLKANIQKVLEENPGTRADQIPGDLVTASGSGLDPHISPAAAQFQAERVAKARGLPPETVRELIEANTEGPQWGLFGEARVNVLRLNLALDEKAPKSALSR
jgi:K+-transporting ATPase ATPase C chain